MEKKKLIALYNMAFDKAKEAKLTVEGYRIEYAIAKELGDVVRMHKAFLGELKAWEDYRKYTHLAYYGVCKSCD